MMIQSHIVPIPTDHASSSIPPSSNLVKFVAPYFQAVLRPTHQTMIRVQDPEMNGEDGHERDVLMNS
jgi:hypothetical protein